MDAVKKKNKSYFMCSTLISIHFLLLQIAVTFVVLRAWNWCVKLKFTLFQVIELNVCSSAFLIKSKFCMICSNDIKIIIIIVFKILWCLKFGPKIMSYALNIYTLYISFINVIWLWAYDKLYTGCPIKRLQKGNWR